MCTFPSFLPFFLSFFLNPSPALPFLNPPHFTSFHKSKKSKQKKNCILTTFRFNAGVDRAFNEPEGAVRNQGVADAGEKEIESGRFAGSTREREVGGGGARRF